MEDQTKGKLGIIFGIIGIIILPIIFGPLAIYFGYKAKKAGLKKLGNTGIALGIISLVLMVFSSLLSKFIIFPILRSILNTSHPVVVFVSGSMTHNEDFENWWDMHGNWYSNRGIDKNMFFSFPYKNGINKGDLLIIKGITYNQIQIGDIVAYEGRGGPIMHRVVNKYQENGINLIETKGDNNKDQITSLFDETRVSEDKIIGKVSGRIPKMGWPKIVYANILS